MVTGTTVCSPSVAIRVSFARHGMGLGATATSDDSGELTLSAPHSGPRGRRSGLDSDSRTPPGPRRDERTRSAGGTVTVNAWRMGCAPVTWTTRLVCLPGGTGTRTTPPSRDCLAGCPSLDTTRRPRARIWRPDSPLAEVSRMVTVFVAGDSVQVSADGIALAPP